MDIKCLNCGEPWDIYHLLHEADPAEARWQFGNIRSEVRRCPACSSRGKRPDQGVAAVEAELIDLCGEDVDAAAAMLADLGLSVEGY